MGHIHVKIVNLKFKLGVPHWQPCPHFNAVRHRPRSWCTAYSIPPHGRTFQVFLREVTVGVVSEAIISGGNLRFTEVLILLPVIKFFLWIFVS